MKTNVSTQQRSTQPSQVARIIAAFTFQVVLGRLSSSITKEVKMDGTPLYFCPSYQSTSAFIARVSSHFLNLASNLGPTVSS